jgi:hypothetical protein
MTSVIRLARRSATSAELEKRCFAAARAATISRARASMRATLSYCAAR